LFLNFEEIIVLTVSSNLSVTHDIINKEALKLIEKGKNITVIDTLLNSGAEGLMVQKTAQLIASGVPTKEIVKQIETDRSNTEILVCLETFKYAMMGGRLPKAVGKIGMLLGIRPIMTLNDKGEGAAFSMAFSKKGITKKIVKYVEKTLEEHDIERFSLVHCLNEPLALEYQTIFTNLIGKEPEYITEVSSAIAVHSGVGTVAISFVKTAK
jgi:DegV family protein with EDD domain